jgi:hypothetical protein
MHILVVLDFVAVLLKRALASFMPFLFYNMTINFHHFSGGLSPKLRAFTPS